MKLDQQIVLITGGMSGIGQACAHWFHQMGSIVVIWDLNVEDEAFSQQTLAVACDVQSSDSAESAMTQTIEQVGIPRVLIQCAGIAPAAKIVGKKGVMPLEDFKAVVDVNLVGTFNVLRVFSHAVISAYPLHSEEQGVAINTASIAAYEGQIGQTAYAASKGGIVSLTLPAARELAKHGIRVNTIAPGLVATPMLLNMPQTVQDSLANSVPFPHRLAKPEEFAMLAQQVIENPMLNGSVIRLDGALRMAAQ